MTIHQETLRRVRVYKEVGASAFAIDHTGTIGDFKDLPFIEAKIGKGQKFIPTGEMVQTIDDYTVEVIGPDEPTLSLKTNLFMAAAGTEAGDALAFVLDVLFGDNDTTASDTVQGAGATTTVIPVTSGAAYQPGNALPIVIGGVTYIREIQGIAANNVTVKYAYPSAPGAGATILASKSWFPGSGYYDSSTSPTLQALVERASDQQMFALLGGQITGITIETPIGEIPTISTEWMFADIIPAGSALADANYGHDHVVAMDSVFRAADITSTTLASDADKASSASFKLNLTYQKIKTFGGVNTVAGYVRLHKPPVVEGEYTVPVESDEHDEAVEDRTAMHVSLQIGESTSVGCVQLVAPTVQAISSELEPIEGVDGVKVVWKGRRDERTSGGSNTALNTAAFRIHFVPPV